ncbi:serine/threonine protein kinase [Thermocatellispora tengchongensis]|uniref:Serine/threonine protein kinase n=1 Tax=Thermocatellispora tengchongensis TaxID=1073253 RepID=A0A840P6U0_9ACTN|nr:serine/threonine-protein kinase [Thermocatellispora tengchongensis]MBB5132937.1 serine/threonine protein kinase [Thermocatellispora tengchongensis]
MPEVRPLTGRDPERVGGYVLCGVLGEGGQGTVYLGRAPSGTWVAVKVLHGWLAGRPEARRRFMRELDAVRRVAPFCTAKVLDVNLFGERPYIVSEYIPGTSLEELVAAEGPRTGSGLERLAVATLTALAAIHRVGIVHRDFKPRNVILGPEGPVVIDFGIAHHLEYTTVHSAVTGTPAYMAPEQFEGRQAGAPADLFAWACTMVYAATGRPAFGGASVPAIMHAIVTREPDLSGVPGELRPLLASCLDKRPEVRPTAAAALRRLTGDATRAMPAPGVLPATATAEEEGDVPTIPGGRAAAAGTPPRSAGATLPPEDWPRRRTGRRRRTVVILAAVLLAITAALVPLALRDGAPSPAPGSSPART